MKLIGGPKCWATRTIARGRDTDPRQAGNGLRRLDLLRTHRLRRQEAAEGLHARKSSPPADSDLLGVPDACRWRRLPGTANLSETRALTPFHSTWRFQLYRVQEPPGVDNGLVGSARLPARSCETVLKSPATRGNGVRKWPRGGRLVSLEI